MRSFQSLVVHQENISWLLLWFILITASLKMYKYVKEK